MTIVPFDYQHPVEFHFGAGKFSELPEILTALGSRVLVCVDAFFAASDHAARLRQLAQLGDSVVVDAAVVDAAVVDQICVSGEPESTAIDEEVAKCKVRRYDCILALGGGSTIDFAKAIALGLANDGPVWDYTNAADPEPRQIANPGVPLVAVPTTAGSGSEMSAISVVSHKESGRKSTIVSPAVYPRAAVVDPELLTSVPPGIRMATAMDAVAHGFENFLNKGSVCEVHRIIGLEAVRRIAPCFEDLSTNTVDLDILAEVAFGSSLAGWANAFGTTGAAHAIAQCFGAKFAIPHAAAVALVLPEVFARTWPAAPEEFALAAGAFAVDSDGPAETLCRRIVQWWRSRKNVVAGETLATLRWNERDIDSLTGQILATMQRPLRRHPVLFSEGDVKEIINSVLNESPRSDREYGPSQ